MSAPNNPSAGKTIRVKIEPDPADASLYYATSPDLGELLVVGTTLEELEQTIPNAIADLYAAHGWKAAVSKAGDGVYVAYKPQ